MALDTAFFSLFPDIYDVGGNVIEEEHEVLEGEAAPEEISHAQLTKEQTAAHKRIPKDFDCLRFLVESFEKKCMPLNDYGLGHVKYLVQFCETKTKPEIVNKVMEMDDTCANLVV